jgi:hypothetical protein
VSDVSDERDWQSRMTAACDAVHAAMDSGASGTEIAALVARVHDLDAEGEARRYAPVPTGGILWDPPEIMDAR